MRVILAALCMLLLAFELRADERRSIDEALLKCVDENSTTSGMVKCTQDAYDEWDGILNLVYQRLSERLTPEAREALKASQRKWLVWRDAEFEVIDRVYATREGTMYLPMRANDRMRVVSDRAMQLINLEGLLDIDE